MIRGFSTSSSEVFASLGHSVPFWNHNILMLGLVIIECCLFMERFGIIKVVITRMPSCGF